jgi:hypothetical protein
VFRRVDIIVRDVLQEWHDLGGTMADVIASFDWGVTSEEEIEAAEVILFAIEEQFTAA